MGWGCRFVSDDFGSPNSPAKLCGVRVKYQKADPLRLKSGSECRVGGGEEATQ